MSRPDSLAPKQNTVLNILHTSSRAIRGRTPAKSPEINEPRPRIRRIKTNHLLRKHRSLLLCTLAALVPSTLNAADGRTETRETIYATGFEKDEGFDLEFSLIDQDDWQALGGLISQDDWRAFFGDGGNGLVDNFFNGEGQQAFIGYTPPESEETVEFFNLLRAVNVADFPDEAPAINFSVTMQIVRSTNNEHDNFRWSVYNLKDDRLFSVDFDNETKNISYILDDDGGLIHSNVTFDNLGVYDLEISMNFHRNIWCAALNGTVIANALPITTKNAELTLSTIDAVWNIFKPGSPGDNYMLFDNYSITRASVPSIPPRVGTQGILPGGKFVLRVFGEPNTEYQVETSSDFKTWTPIKTGKTSADDATFDIVDEDAPDFKTRFYRATTIN
ncbi:MAG: hypothetical protein M2R45_01669 [Verrucomicrobia subdivision 3 bacterium]|nr:hypothetical protein [Limisphaerales bacterium]MCS1412820.1 hypothetical protein [Limisphaerales bacterium]